MKKPMWGLMLSSLRVACVATLCTTGAFAIGPDRTEVRSIELDQPITVAPGTLETVVTLHTSAPVCLHSVLMTTSGASDSESIFLNSITIDGVYDTGIPFPLLINDTIINNAFLAPPAPKGPISTGPNVHDMIRNRVAGFDQQFRVPQNSSFDLFSFMNGVLLHYTSLVQSEAFALAIATAQADAQAEAYADSLAIAFAESAALAESIATAAAAAVAAAESYAAAAALAASAAEASADAQAIAQAEAAASLAAQAVAQAEAIASAVAQASGEAGAAASSAAEAQAYGSISGEVSQSKTSFSASFGASAGAGAASESYVNAMSSAESMTEAAVGTFTTVEASIEAAIAASAGAGATAEAAAAAGALAAAGASADAAAAAVATAVANASAYASVFASAFAMADAVAFAVAEAEAIAIALAIAEAEVSLYTTICKVLEGPYCGEFAISLTFSHFPTDGFTMDFKEIYTTADGGAVVLDVNQALPTEPLDDPIVRTSTLSIN